MKRLMGMVLGLLAIAIITGCSGTPPQWVEAGSGPAEKKWGKAIYGIGVAAPTPDPEDQLNIAKLSAKTEIARAEKDYIAGFAKDVMKKHPDSFNAKAASSVKLPEKVAQQIADATYFDTEVVNKWRDGGGKLAQKGSLYILMKVDLDDEFFDLLEVTLKGLLQKHQSKVLKGKAEKAFAELKKEIVKLRMAPVNYRAPVPAKSSEKTGKKENKKGSE
ncbi:MAG: hypothetical protein KGZ25_11325 [Planctomycetes bacterium]|nr:hypothetical protein [Planctomycetota bacterium]